MSYWTDRAALRQAVYDRSSAQTMGIVSDAHKRMLGDLREDARRIIGNFEKAFDLTPAEARKLLKSPLPAKEAERLRERIDLITDPAYKKLMQAKVSSGAYAHRLNRLEGIQMSAETAAIKVADVEKTIGLQHLENTIYQGYGRTMYDVQKYTGIAFQFKGVDERRVKQILRNQWSGKSFSTRVWLNNEEMARQLSRALTERVLQGKTTRETFKALSNLSDMGRMAANRLLSTETNYIANQATAEAYEDAGIERYRYIAVLDGRTSSKCQDLDGKEFLLSEKETGVNYPPAHVFCRSSVAPVIPGFVREGMKRWARDPKTGEQMYVDANMTYKQWIETIKPREGTSALKSKLSKALNK